MPIVNEIDETGRANSRTIDTETGVVLTLEGYDIRDRYCFFSVSDGGARLTILAKKDWQTDGSTHRVTYSVLETKLSGKPSRTDYCRVIESLIKAHGDNFRAMERKRGYRESVEVSFSPHAQANVRAWEGRRD